MLFYIGCTSTVVDHSVAAFATVRVSQKVGVAVSEFDAQINGQGVSPCSHTI